MGTILMITDYCGLPMLLDITHSNKEIENFIDKYLTTNHFILEENLCSAETHQHMQPC
jgi:hypothetical protein